MVLAPTRVIFERPDEEAARAELRALTERLVGSTNPLERRER